MTKYAGYFILNAYTDRHYCLQIQQQAADELAAMELTLAELRDALDDMALIVENNKTQIGYHDGSNIDRMVKTARTLTRKKKGV